MNIYCNFFFSVLTLTAYYYTTITTRHNITGQEPPCLNSVTLLPQVTFLLAKIVFLFCLCEAEDASEREKRDLLYELALLKNLDPHPHVIQLFGCISTESKFVK